MSHGLNAEGGLRLVQNLASSLYSLHGVTYELIFMLTSPAYIHENIYSSPGVLF